MPEVFRDDFNTSPLNPGKWRVYDDVNPNERTFFGTTPILRTEAGLSFYRFFLHRYNPEHHTPAPGFFKGTEIYSFPFEITKRPNVGGYVELETRLRGTAVPSGAVAAFFTYSTIGSGSTGDEIDFEFVGKLGPHSVWLNTWNDSAQSHTTYTNAAFNWQSNWNTYKIRWVTDAGNTRYVEWYINGALVRTARNPEHIPDDGMQIHFNSWVPDNTWPEAYDANLKPALNQASDFTWYYDVDYIVVRTG
ncbi:MAG: glycoside hydrolase family 16 protein [Abitibacteriaceae bacterium]|nr:glycoside hydrolase family 16 protein [Abditibacteriaceae bacterium]